MSEENAEHFKRIAQQSVGGGAITPPTRLVRPGGGRSVTPAPAVTPTAGLPVAAAAEPAGEEQPDMVRLNWYMPAQARTALTRMRDEVFHAANIAVPGSAPQKYDAAAALIEVVEGEFERLKHLALAKLTQRG